MIATCDCQNVRVSIPLDKMNDCNEGKINKRLFSNRFDIAANCTYSHIQTHTIRCGGGTQMSCLCFDMLSYHAPSYIISNSLSGGVRCKHYSLPLLYVYICVCALTTSGVVQVLLSNRYTLENNLRGCDSVNESFTAVCLTAAPSPILLSFICVPRSMYISIPIFSAYRDSRW